MSASDKLFCHVMLLLINQFIFNAFLLFFVDMKEMPESTIISLTHKDSLAILTLQLPYLHVYISNEV